jgi:hypothetical protein
MTQNPYYPYPPPAAPQPVNGLAIAGFIVSLLGFFTACILSPVGLLLSFIALFKRPRGFAVAGLILGMIGSLIPLLFVGFFGVMIFSAIAMGSPGIRTFGSVQEAHTRIDSAASTNDYTLPDDPLGEIAISDQKDGWGNPLRYRRLSPGRYEIRSAGRDGLLNTADDLEQSFPVPSRPKPE